MSKIDEHGLSKYQRKVLEREGKFPPERELEFYRICASEDAGHWDSLYEDGGATWERMDHNNVWFNSDFNVLGPVVIYKETCEYEGNVQTIELTLYNNGSEVAQREVPEDEDWFFGPQRIVTAFARDILANTEEV